MTTGPEYECEFCEDTKKIRTNGGLGRVNGVEMVFRAGASIPCPFCGTEESASFDKAVAMAMLGEHGLN